MAGLWKQIELDQYTFLDLVDVNRVLYVQDENKRRARQAAEEKQRRQ